MSITKEQAIACHGGEAPVWVKTNVIINQDNYPAEYGVFSDGTKLLKHVILDRSKAPRWVVLCVALKSPWDYIDAEGYLTGGCMYEVNLMPIGNGPDFPIGPVVDLVRTKTEDEIRRAFGDMITKWELL